MNHTHFLSIDVQVESRKPLKPLADALRDEVMICYENDDSEIKTVAFQDAGIDGGPEYNLESLCQLVMNLQGDARAAWYQSLCRRFDFGFQCGYDETGAFTPTTYMTVFNPGSIALLQELGATVAITIYPPDERDAKMVRDAGVDP